MEGVGRDPFEERSNYREIERKLLEAADNTTDIRAKSESGGHVM